jgi:8-amino-7-oxononanoate synthase
MIGDEKKALNISQKLFERGFWVVAIRPPTVPAGTSRLRITLSAEHSLQQVEELLLALQEVGAGPCACPGFPQGGSPTN